MIVVLPAMIVVVVVVVVTIVVVVAVKWSLPDTGLLGRPPTPPGVSQVLTQRRNVGLRPSHRGRRVRQPRLQG